MRSRLSHVAATALLASTVIAAPAITSAADEYDPIRSASRVSEIRDHLSDPDISSNELADLRGQIVNEQILAEQCEQAATADRARLDARYEPLKDITADAQPETFGQYLEISQQREAAIALQARCAAVLDEAQQLIATITRLQTERSTAFLETRGKNVIAELRDIPARMVALYRGLKDSFGLQLAAGVTPILLFWVLVAGGALAALAGVFIRLQFNKRYQAAGGDSAPPRFRFLFPKPLAEHAAWLIEGIVLGAILLAAIEGASEATLVVRLALSLSLYGIGCVIADWATGPLSPASGIKGLIPKHVAPLRRRLRIWFMTLALSFVLLDVRWIIVPTVAIDVTGRGISILLVALAQIYLIAYLARIPGLRGRFRLIRVAAILTLLAGIIAVLLGFHNLAAYLVHGVTRTALALFLLWILLWGVQTLFDLAIKDDADAAQHFRRRFGLNQRSARTGLGLVQLVTDLAIWATFLGFVIYVWDDAGTTVGSIYEYTVKGFVVGEITLVPAKIIMGVLVFIAMLIVIGWIKTWIDRRWLQQIVTERGAREALVTLFGYVGFVAAILISLTMAGIDLTGLAFISAALALGIGFGMQEIASNFVSGLILLFERPIRAGDFVTVGETDGFVRSIRIRATEIESLDNQNVLVPNSELVSGRVTNWVLRDTAGRLRARVGVAYGSDVEKVRDILESVGNEHSEVITDGSAPAPRALFLGFGDSSLDFELRVRVYRIDRRFTVLSDLNFAIDKAFRENGITIPFPQRDLHIVSYPEETPKAAPAKPAPDREPGQTYAPLPGTITRQHTESIDIKTNAESVWAALTDIDAQKQWLIDDGEFNPNIGGQFRWELPDSDDSRGATSEGRIDIFIPNYRMRLVLAPGEGIAPLPTGPLTIDFRLERHDESTVVNVTSAGFPADEDWEEDFNWSVNRWRSSLKALASHLGQ